MGVVGIEMHTKAINLDSSLYETEGRPVNQPEQSKRDSKLIIALLGLQTFVLLMLLAGGTMAYRHFSEKADKIDAVVTVIENPSQMLNQPELVKSLVILLQNTSADFFFGSSRGSIPSFVNNIMQTDFGSWAKTVRTFADDVTSSFLADNATTLCNQWVNCEPNSEIQCSDGTIQWCDWSGSVNCAVDSSCVAPSIVTGASLVSSIASRLEKWQQLTGPSDGPAAFSAGIFRLDLYLDWFKNQADAASWNVAGTTCSTFVNQLQSISWNGTYVDGAGEVQTWHANSAVGQVATYVEQVCSGLQGLGENQAKHHGSSQSTKKKPSGRRNAKQLKNRKAN
jgi:hypothetical protein